MKKKITMLKDQVTAANYMANFGFGKLSPLMISAIEQFAALKVGMAIKETPADMEKFERDYVKDSSNKYVRALKEQEGEPEIYTNNPLSSGN